VHNISKNRQLFLMRESAQKKYKFVGEKDNNWQLFVTKKDNILNLLKSKVCTKE